MTLPFGHWNSHAHVSGHCLYAKHGDVLVTSTATSGRIHARSSRTFSNSTCNFQNVARIPTPQARAVWQLVQARRGIYTQDVPKSIWQMWNLCLSSYCLISILQSCHSITPCGLRIFEVLVFCRPISSYIICVLYIYICIIHISIILYMYRDTYLC
jgi:hypothetical protein